MKILVIEDDATVLNMMLLMLGNEGFEVLSACDGEQGIETLKQHPEVGLVITDLIMPNKEGIETILEARKINPDAKILAMSGGGRGGAMTYLSAAKSIGADATLAKPFVKDDLLQSLALMGISNGN